MQNTDMFGMPDLSAYAVNAEVGVSDEALEAELAALLEEEDDDAPQITRQRRPAPAPAKPNKTGINLRDQFHKVFFQWQMTKISDKSADNQSEARISLAYITKTVICHWWEVFWNGALV